MRIDEIMTKDVRTIGPEAPASEAASLMKNHGIHHLVVLKAGRVVGVVSSRDVKGGRGMPAQAVGTVADVMTPSPVTSAPDVTLRRAANLMRGRSIGCLPVLGPKGLCGMVTISDLLELLGHGVERTLPAEKRRKTDHPGGTRGQKREAVRVRGR